VSSVRGSSDPPSNMDACLPADLRASSTTITKIAAGMSGAGVYRIAAGGEQFVLKVSPPGQPADEWRRVVEVQQLAAAAALAPRIVHSNEDRRAVLSAFVPDQSFPALYGDPRTRGLAILKLGQMLRRMHDLPLPAGLRPAAPHVFARELWSGPLADLAVPAFVEEAVQRALAGTPAADDEALVLSHNDLNPTNLIFDGDRLLMLDWETAAANEPFYDLATVANFLRMDDSSSRALLDAYGTPAAILPDRYRDQRRLSAALVGGLLLNRARQSGHAGATGGETRESTASLGEVYAGLRDGSISLATPDGQWRFGLAMVKDGSSV